VVFMMPSIARAQVAHTSRNPLVPADALETFPDGAVFTLAQEESIAEVRVAGRDV
jgi:hypothetical protein